MNTDALSHNRDSSDITQLKTNYSPINLSFEEFYKKYLLKVYGICLRLTQNKPDAEDITQDILLRVYYRLSSFRGESAFTSWLYKVTVNQVYMHFRKKSVHCEQTTETGEMPELAEQSSYRIQSQSILDRIALLNAIDKLPPGYRSIFLLHDLKGYKHHEVAHLLGICTGTSKSQLNKARLKLRTLLCEQI